MLGSTSTSDTSHNHDHNHGHDVGERLYIHRHSVVHSAPAHLKILAGLLFIIVGVATSISNWQAFACYFLLIGSVLAIAKLPVKKILARATVEIPFVLFAFLMPFFGTGEKFEILGLSLYREGLLAGAAIIAKGTLGLLVAITLSGSTKAREIIGGLERLRLPALMVQIATFMLRYVNVVSDEMERMKVARISRGFEARGIADWKILAQAAGALFIRSYERGERVHLAMLSRGYSGNMPTIDKPAITYVQKLIVFSLPVFALTILLLTNLIWSSR
ncbi:MAG: cobalt ECF transporter T component CbiQ [Candidatus Nanopelagicaceae bacterium]